MEHRRYGASGLRVSALGFGAMRLPTRRDGQCDLGLAVPILRRAIALGVNYFDSAYDYLGGTSEMAVGEAIQPYPRADLIVSTKIPIGHLRGREWRRRLETQLRRLNTEYIDIMHFHSLGWSAFQSAALGPEGCLRAARQAQAEGLIRHLAFSSHDSPSNVLRLIETGEFEGLLLQYNLLDRRMADALWAASQRQMGVAVMGPLGGGRLALRRTVGGYAAPDLALRWVLSNPAVSVTLSGMNTLAMVEENAASASRTAPFESGELAAISELAGAMRGLRDLYCTGCGYCLPCPQGVDIPGNLLLLNVQRLLGQTEAARQAYACLLRGEATQVGEATLTGAAAALCVRCGACEPQCPQGLAIMDQLAQAHNALH